MSSQVLARKYRPKTLEDVVGQETTVRILRNALEQKKIHHAYLFSGPRGIGKTSLARIFARALNCEKGPTAIPCGTCASCLEIGEGRSLSVMEIDGASNRRIEDVRDLREQVNYLPPGGRYKIYIVDEVHMLTKEAFNAFLKTLEEPPPHVVFIFATTEADKILPTVLSRVIRFDLRQIPSALIVERLRKIAKAESVKIDDKALYLIARDAQGGLRDALSLLDQIISFSGQDISEAKVEEVIGVSTRRFVFGLLEAILKKDPAQALKISEEASAAGVELKKLSVDLLEYARHLVVARVSRNAALFDLPVEEIQELSQLSQGASPEDLDRIFQILQRGTADILRSPLPKILFDVLLVRLCQFEGLRPIDEILKMLEGEKSGTQEKRPASKSWSEFMAFLRSNKPNIYSMMQEGRLASLGDSEVVLHFPTKSIQLALLTEPERDEGLRATLGQFFGRPLAIRYEPLHEGALASADSSSAAPLKIVDEAISVFGAKTVTNPDRGPNRGIV